MIIKVKNLTILLWKFAVVRLAGKLALVVSFSMILTRPLNSSASLSSTGPSVVVGIVVGAGVASGFSVTPSPAKYGISNRPGVASAVLRSSS